MKVKWSHGLKISLILLIAILCSAAVGAPDHVSEAQTGGTISYGSSVTGSIASDTPMALYFFNATQGDLVHVDAMGLTGGLDPVIDLLAPDRQAMASSQYNSLAVDMHDAHIALYVPQTGVYSLVIGGVNGTAGDFLLELNGRSPVSSIPLIFGQALPVTIPPDALPQYFTFTAEDCPTTLTVANPAPGDPFTFPFVVKVRDAQAHDVAILRGGDTLEDRVTVEPLSGSYEVEVWSDDPLLSGTLSLVVSCAGEAPVCLSSTAAVGEAGCPDCPPCPDNDDPLCADFAVSVEVNEDGIMRISWTPVEGAGGAIVSIDDAAGELWDARMVMDTLTSTIYAPHFWALGTPPYTVHVTAVTEDGYNLCTDTVTVAGDVFSGLEPADEECEIAIVAPRETMVNGLQTIFWTDVPLATSYWVRVFGQDDVARADGSIMAPATSMTLDVSEAAIGMGYDGGNEFYISVQATRGGEPWCSSGVRVTRIMMALGE